MDESGRRMQVRLGDLGVAVIGSAFVFDVTRRSRMGWVGGVPDRAHVVGLVVLSLGVGLGLILLGQAVRGVRDRRWWAVSWRFLAMSALCWLVAQMAGDLQFDKSKSTGISPSRGEMQLNLDPLMTSLALVGLTLALTPPRRRTLSASRRRRWMSRLSVILAAVVGLVLVAEGYGMYPYLVLMALEAVQNALRGAPLVARPIVFDRLNLACLEALPGLVGCLLTALWISDDIRADALTPRSRVGLVGRVATVVLALVGSGFVLVSSIPRLSPPVAEGIASILDRATLAALAIGFGGFSLGIAARSAARLVDPGEPVASLASRFGPWPWRVVGFAVGLLALEVTAAAMQTIRGDESERWYIPISLTGWLLIFERPAIWLGVPGLLAFGDSLLDRLGLVLMSIAAAWILCRMFRLVVSKASGEPASLDLVAADRVTLGRFLAWWFGLWAMMLASLPVVAITAVTLTHHLVRWVSR